jgi:DNA-binding transcriptional LysR family regulator
MTFGSSSWALAYLLRKGGSAYLPWRLSEPHVKAGRLHPVRGAAEFSRTLHFSWRQDSLTSHPWLTEDGNR